LESVTVTEKLAGRIAKLSFEQPVTAGVSVEVSRMRTSRYEFPCVKENALRPLSAAANRTSDRVWITVHELRQFVPDSSPPELSLALRSSAWTVPTYPVSIAGPALSATAC